MAHKARFINLLLLASTMAPDKKVMWCIFGCIAILGLIIVSAGVPKTIVESVADALAPTGTCRACTPE